MKADTKLDTTRVRVIAFCVDLGPAKGAGVSDCPTYVCTVEIDHRGLALLAKNDEVVRVALELIREQADGLKGE